jgi:uncharacterized protein YukJ
MQVNGSTAANKKQQKGTKPYQQKIVTTDTKIQGIVNSDQSSGINEHPAVRLILVQW